MNEILIKALNEKNIGLVTHFVDNNIICEVDFFIKVYQCIERLDDDFYQIFQKAVDNNIKYLITYDDSLREAPIRRVIRGANNSGVLTDNLELQKAKSALTLKLIKEIDVFEASFITILFSKDTTSASAFQHLAATQPYICLDYFKQNLDKAQHMLSQTGTNPLVNISHDTLRPQMVAYLEKQQLQIIQTHKKAITFKL